MKIQLMFGLLACTLFFLKPVNGQNCNDVNDDQVIDLECGLYVTNIQTFVYSNPTNCINTAKPWFPEYFYPGYWSSGVVVTGGTQYTDSYGVHWYANPAQNCHGFTFGLSGQNVRWGAQGVDKYFNTGVYVRVKNEADATVVQYFDQTSNTYADHTAKTTTTPGIHESKWSYGMQARHPADECPWCGTHYEGGYTVPHYFARPCDLCAKYGNNASTIINTVLHPVQRFSNSISICNAGYSSPCSGIPSAPTITTPPTNKKLCVGSQKTLQAATAICAEQFLWTTSNGSIASVSGSGATATVTANGVGTATISLRIKNIHGTSQAATYTINTQQCCSLSAPNFIHADPSVCIGGIADFHVTPMTGVDGYIWTSSNTYVATVEEQDYTGLATGLHAGSTTISVRAYIGSCLGPTSSRTLVVNNCGFRQVDAENERAVVLGVSPNPAADQATLQVYLPQAADWSFNIYDLNGKLVHAGENTQLPAGLNQVRLETTGWASGVYLIKARAGAQQQSCRFVVSH